MNHIAQRVEHLRGLGRLDEAERLAREGLAADPNDPELLTALAAVLLRARRPADGLAAADAAGAVLPQDERVHRLRALLLSQLGRHIEAELAAREAMALAPNEPLPVTALARVLQAAGRLREAVPPARKVVEMAPDNAASHFLLADITSDLGDRRTARAAYLEALRLDPEHATARHDLAVLDLRSHRPAMALRGLIDAGRLDPSEPIVLENVKAVLWVLSWRLRVYVVATTLICIIATNEAMAQPTWTARTVATLSLAAGAVFAWWLMRDLPRRTLPVVREALRRDRPLLLTFVALGVCVALFVAVAVTGYGVFAAPTWPLLIFLSVLSVFVGIGRLLRRLLRRRAPSGR